MKLRNLIILAFFLFPGISIMSQTNKLPSVDVFTLDGNRVNANSITNNNLPMVMVFFKTYDKDCLKHLTELNDVYEETLKNSKIKIVAICIDCNGQMANVKPFVSGRDLDMEVYVDKNGDFKRLLGVFDAPFTMLYDNEMNLVCKYNGYCSGNQVILCDKVKECLKKMESSNN